MKDTAYHIPVEEAAAEAGLKKDITSICEKNVRS
jgi:hypothetical protein